MMNYFKQEGINLHFMSIALEIYPILNSNTVYQTNFIPSTGYMKSKVEWSSTPTMMQNEFNMSFTELPAESERYKRMRIEDLKFTNPIAYPKVAKLIFNKILKNLWY